MFMICLLLYRIYLQTRCFDVHSVVAVCVLFCVMKSVGFMLSFIYVSVFYRFLISFPYSVIDSLMMVLVFFNGNF